MVLNLPGAMAVILLCSIVDMACILNWETKTDCWGSKISWQFACACVSAVFTIVWLLLNKFVGDTAKKLAPFLCVFLAIWWFFGAYIGTFWAPYVRTGNGYFAVWLAFACSFFAAYQSVSQFHEAADKVIGLAETHSTAIAFVLVASILELTAASLDCDRANYGGSDGCSKNDILVWAVCVGAISLIICVGMIVYTKVKGNVPGGAFKIISVTLMVWWLTALWRLTFKYWTSTGNAYFSLWVGGIASLYLGMQALGKDTSAAPHSAGEAKKAADSMSVPGLLSIVFLCSALILYDIGDQKRGVAGNTSKIKWQFSCALISLVFCWFWLLANMFMGDMATKTGPMLCGFLAFWWFGGAFYCTTWAPYTTTGNGYFCNWLAFIASFLAAYKAVAQFREAAHKVTHLGPAVAVLVWILVASIVELTVGSILCDHWGDVPGCCNGCKNKVAYSVALGAISLIIIIGMLIFMKVQGKIDGIPWKVLTVLLAVWWVCGAIFLTFGSAHGGISAYSRSVPWRYGIGASNAAYYCGTGASGRSTGSQVCSCTWCGGSRNGGRCPSCARFSNDNTHCYRVCCGKRRRMLLADMGDDLNEDLVMNHLEEGDDLNEDLVMNHTQRARNAYFAHRRLLDSPPVHRRRDTVHSHHNHQAKANVHRHHRHDPCASAQCSKQHNLSAEQKFSVTGNGYFAVWAATLMSVYLAAAAFGVNITPSSGTANAAGEGKMDHAGTAQA